ncbi:hypothetical protein REPUB_Repub19eG0095400 [Reevesia pubescens]
MVHKQYSGVINLYDHSLDRTVSLSEIGGPSNYDFNKHTGIDEKVEDIKLWNHQPHSKDSTLPGNDAPSTCERTSPDGCSDGYRESQDFGGPCQTGHLFQN